MYLLAPGDASLFLRRAFLCPPLGGPIDPPPLKIAPYFFFHSPLAPHFSPPNIGPVGHALPRLHVSPNPDLVMDRPRVVDIIPVSNSCSHLSPFIHTKHTLVSILLQCCLLLKLLASLPHRNKLLHLLLPIQCFIIPIHNVFKSKLNIVFL